MLLIDKIIFCSRNSARNTIFALTDLVMNFRNASIKRWVKNEDLLEEEFSHLDLSNRSSIICLVKANEKSPFCGCSFFRKLLRRIYLGSIDSR